MTHCERKSRVHLVDDKIAKVGYLNYFLRCSIRCYQKYFQHKYKERNHQKSEVLEENTHL